MKFRLVIPSAVQQEVTEALRYYLSINNELAERFLSKVEEAYTRLENHPQHYSFFGESKIIRSLNLDVFPYCFVFRVDAEEVLLVALHNTHQNPQNFLNRI